MNSVPTLRMLNLGCGFNKFSDGWINVDAHAICKPDVRMNLEDLPWPWEDNSVDQIAAWHVFEHLHNWWAVFTECSRVLKPGGIIEIRIPDESSSSAITHKDHFHIFDQYSFHGTMDSLKGKYTNAWFAEQPVIPLVLVSYHQVPFAKYNWMAMWGFRWLLSFCSNHLRNFIWEQRWVYTKVAGCKFA